MDDNNNNKNNDLCNDDSMVQSFFLQPIFVKKNVSFIIMQSTKRQCIPLVYCTIHLVVVCFFFVA